DGCLPRLFAGCSVNGVSIALQITEIKKVPAGLLRRSDADCRADSTACLIGPVNASRPGIDGVDKTGVHPQKDASCDDGRLPINSLCSRKTERPFQLQLRYLFGSEVGRLRILKPRIRDARSPAIPGRLGGNIAQRRLRRATIRH